MTQLKSFNLSNQALGAVMMALQKSLMDQSDIVPVLKGFDFVPTNDGLVVKNPPMVKAQSDGMVFFDEIGDEEEPLVGKTTSE
jgi:hypothetical protein